MDYSQPNKINSMASRHQTYKPHVQSYHRSIPPHFQQSCQPESFQIPNQSGNFCRSNVQPKMYSGGDINRNYMQKPSNGQVPFPVKTCWYNQPKPPGEVQQYPYEAEEEEASQDEDIDIEYFQCTPTRSTSNKQKNPFKNVMQSMQKYSKSRINHHQPQTLNNDVNHQTIICKHESDENNEDDQQTELAEHKVYRSHTKIEAIPRGVRIITDILNEDNEEDHESSSASCPNRHTQTDDKWLNKKIDVTVEEDDEDDEN